MRRVFAIIAIALSFGILYGALTAGQMDPLRLRHLFLATATEEDELEEPKQIDPVALASRGCTLPDVFFQRKRWFLLSESYRKQRQESRRFLTAAYLFWRLAKERGIDLEKLRHVVPFPIGAEREELLARMVRLALAREHMLRVSGEHLELFRKSKEKEEYILERMRRFPTCT